MNTVLQRFDITSDIRPGYGLALGYSRVDDGYVFCLISLFGPAALNESHVAPRFYATHF